MPCDSSHCEPNSREIESRKVIAVLIELGVPADVVGKYHPLYGEPKKLDAHTALACSRLREFSPHDIRNDLSLETQIWWRDHQAADVRKENERKAAARQAHIRTRALRKLTPEERRALGVK